jgi:hypothetical protein
MIMKNKAAKKSRQIDLSEYSEEALPFDAVIRQIAKVKPAHLPAKKKPAKSSRKIKRAQN